ncbi:DsbA family protein [Uliginosibacterium sp. H1]|uniref:DsbA family protein n=1 Tax=Uliginosibacterium sp. H1 TaxID=3114757 RepID=UPI002E179863|nr:DsbA family protein [Uliginosibacterium sp. H1]
MAATLHYIYDPLCGWCYAAAPLIEAAAALPGLRIDMHAGGMMAGSARRPVTEGLRNYVLPHDERITKMTGQPFGDAYRDGLLRDTTAVLDSEPPITGILAAERLVAGGGLRMLHRVQQAHYVEGQRIADAAVLEACAKDIGLDTTAFSQACAEQAGAKTQAHIDASRRMLDEVGGSGFPTVVLQTSEGVGRVELGEFLGQPQVFAEKLGEWLDSLPASEITVADGPACDLDGRNC